MRKAIVHLAMLLLLTSNMVPISVQAQTKHWNIKARDQSANLVSAGLNYLVDKKQKKKRKERDNLIFASKFFEKAIEVDPENATAHNLLALCLTLTGECDRALNLLGKASQLGGQDAENLATTGIAQYLNHNFEISLNIWNKLFKVSPDKSPALTCLGYGLIRKGDFVKSIKCLEQAKQVSPQSAFVFDGLARCYYFQGDLETARNYATQANALGEYNFTSSLLSRCDLFQGRYQEASRAASRLKSRPNQYKMGRSLAFLGYSKLYDLEADPFQLDNHDSGIVIMSRIKDMMAYEKQKPGVFKSSGNKLTAFLDKARSGMALSKDDYYVLYQIGLIQSAMGDFAGAQTSFEQAIKHNPQALVILLDLAYCYTRSNQTAKAVSCLQSFKSQWPNLKLAPFYEHILKSAGNANSVQSSPQKPQNQQPDLNTKDSGF